MVKFNTLLNLRLKQKKSNTPKMTALVEKAKSGNLSSFSGVFKVTPPTEEEKQKIKKILTSFKTNEIISIEKDLEDLSILSSEVKAITNQAVILHGERIKRAQNILKSYQDGAFTAFLLETYGNRQTPYNFLQYFEFYQSMPQDLHKQIDNMPRQAIYALASRTGDSDVKKELVKNYQGETKNELLSAIRDKFPIDEKDNRISNPTIKVIKLLRKINDLSNHNHFKLSDSQKKEIQKLLNSFLKNF